MERQAEGLFVVIEQRLAVGSFLCTQQQGQ